jgi:putative Mn2+ efflux pump MntP
MSFFEVLLLSVGLAMDAFAVSVGKGLTMRRVHYPSAFKLAFAFGLFQALMPVVGYVAAASFAQAVQSVSGWIAFILLGIIGGKMVWEGIHDGEDDDNAEFAGVPLGELLVLAIATSIDALAVGISFAVLGTPPVPAVIVIGVVTFLLSLAGVVAGNRLGAGIGRPATIAGGLILVGIGVKVLLFP